MYYTNYLILLAKNMLCGKLSCQKVLTQLPFHIRPARRLMLRCPQECVLRECKGRVQPTPTTTVSTLWLASFAQAPLPPRLTNLLG